MRLEDMKNEIPETPAFIHEMIQKEVQSQLQNRTAAINDADSRIRKEHVTSDNPDSRTREQKVIPMKKGRRKPVTFTKAAAVAAVCMLTVSAAAYAGTKLYHMYLDPQEKYSVSVGLEAETGSEKISLPDEVSTLALTSDYIPEGMVWNGQHLGYPGNTTGGITFAFLLLDENDLGRALKEKNVIDSEQRTFGSYEGVYLKYSTLPGDTGFNQRVYLLCPDLYHVVIAYIGEDVSKEDALRVMDHLVLSPAGSMTATAGAYTWSEYSAVEKQPDRYEDYGFRDRAGDSELTVRSIGETFTLPAYAQNSAGEYVTGDPVIDVCVDSVETADDLQLLDPDLIPDEWTNALNPDGTLPETALYYIKTGDGEGTLDEIVKTETVKQKLVYAAVTYTNTGTEALEHIGFRGNLLLVNHEDGVYQMTPRNYQSGEDYDRIFWNSALLDSRYRSVSDSYGDGGNYIPSLQPGESIQINMAWIVTEQDLSRLYLNLDFSGGEFEFTDSMLQTGLVDIRQ